MALADHKRYNTVESIAEVVREAFTGTKPETSIFSTKAAILLGQDRFNVQEIGSFADAFLDAHDDESFVQALTSACEEVQTPFDNPPGYDDPKVTPIGSLASEEPLEFDWETLMTAHDHIL